MTDTSSDDQFAARIGDELRASENELDPEVLARLQAARRAAVAEADRGEAANAGGLVGQWQRWTAVAALASVVFAVAVLYGPSFGPSSAMIGYL